MKDLFFHYKENGKISEALIVGQNMFGKTPGEKDCFEPYFMLLVELASNGEVSKRNSFLQQAMTTIAIFSENAQLTEELVEYIQKNERLLESIYNEMESANEEKKRDFVKDKIQFNDDALILIEKLLLQLSSAKTKEEFEKTIQTLGKVDSSIDKEYMSERQLEKYSELTKNSSNLVSTKMACFEETENREYNIKAIEAYKNAFDMFKNNEITESHKEVMRNLFSFDASRLYNETLVYYNHVYNYILNKLSDDDKFTLTKYAILSEKRGRR